MGNPSRKKITKLCPAAMASAVRVASSTKSPSLPVCRTNRGPEASQKASPNRSDGLTPTMASCRSSTALMKCAWPITTLTSSGLSTDTTSQANDIEVTNPCCHQYLSAGLLRPPDVATSSRSGLHALSSRSQLGGDVLATCRTSGTTEAFPDHSVMGVMGAWI
ncbi:Uncharacterised protein [Mycobacterium tuberculosis]|nr:Uncharacterised protein [Mycobacterium tuberculosis]